MKNVVPKAAIVILSSNVFIYILLPQTDGDSENEGAERNENIHHGKQISHEDDVKDYSEPELVLAQDLGIDTEIREGNGWYIFVI